MKFNIGQMVTYVSEKNGQHLPAVITHIWSQETGCVNLQVFKDDGDGSYLRTSRLYAEEAEAKPGTWHFVRSDSVTISDINRAMQK